jgi:hypothetical protein
MLSYIRLNFLVAQGHPLERRQKTVRLESQDDAAKVVILIKTAKRDLREKVDGKPNKMYKKIAYETEYTYNVLDAKPEEVDNVVRKALESAVKK